MALLLALSCAGTARVPVHSSQRTNTPVPSPPTPSASTPSTPALSTGHAPVISHGPRDRAEVAITFDSNMTDFMLAELDRHQVESFDNREVIDELEAMAVPATFFLAGKWMERYPDETRRLAGNALFELGTHSYAHKAYQLPCYGLAGLARTDMEADLRRVRALLATFTDNPTPYFRFPGGCYDQAALDQIAPVGAVVVQYDVASGDAFGQSVGAIVAQTLGSAGNGSIVVMHITGGNTAPLTARALPQIVAGLRGRGLRLVKLSELLR